MCRGGLGHQFFPLAAQILISPACLSAENQTRCSGFASKKWTGLVSGEVPVTGICDRETRALLSLCTWEVGPGQVFPRAPELTAWLALTLRAFTFLSGLEGTASPSGANLSTEVFLEGTQCGHQHCL